MQLQYIFDEESYRGVTACENWARQITKVSRYSARCAMRNKAVYILYLQRILGTKIVRTVPFRGIRLNLVRTNMHAPISCKPNILHRGPLWLPRCLGALKMREWKMQEWKLQEKTAGVEIAGVEEAGVDRTGGICRSGKSRSR